MDSSFKNLPKLKLVESLPAKLFNKLLAKLNYSLVKKHHSSEMVTLEQLCNFDHLISQLIVFQTKGDFVELGTFTGNTALFIQQILSKYNPGSLFHIFDRFDETFFSNGRNTLEVLKNNFQMEGLPLPVIHKGLFSETLPGELPAQIAFVHIDCGFGGDIHEHRDTVLFCLNAVYSRMVKNGVCILMDYHDKDKTIKGLNSNPGVKLACDSFLKDKPEEIKILYGGEFSHAFFRKK